MRASKHSHWRVHWRDSADGIATRAAIGIATIVAARTTTRTTTSAAPNAATTVALTLAVASALPFALPHTLPAPPGSAPQCIATRTTTRVDAINAACESLKAAGARRAMVLPVGGAFHSPLMKPAEEQLAAAIEATVFSAPQCPIYQNVTTTAVSNADEIKKNLISQLTSPVKWTQSVRNMVKDGATLFTEVGPGKVLQGLVKKIEPTVEAVSAEVS